MSNPDKVVCETVTAFRDQLREATHLTLLLDPLPGDSVTLGGRTIVYCPPPPVDPVEAAFDKWWEEHIRDPMNDLTLCGRCFRAFLAGRASASPFDGKRIRAQEWNSTLVTVSHMDEVRGVPGLVDRLLSMRVEVPK